MWKKARYGERLFNQSIPRVGMVQHSRFSRGFPCPDSMSIAFFPIQIPVRFSSQFFSGFVFWCSPWLNKRVTKPSLVDERKGRKRRKRRFCQKIVVDGDSPYLLQVVSWW